MLRLLKRSAIALLVIIVGLVLQGLGVSAGTLVAAVGLVALLLLNVFAPWPWQQRWRE